METNQARTLAYNLAKVLDYKELDEVSGGGDNICMTPSLTVSGNSSSMDVTVDVKVDW